MVSNDQTQPTGRDDQCFRRLMTLEVNAAVQSCVQNVAGSAARSMLWMLTVELIGACSVSAKGTLRNILADAGLTVEEFRRLI